MLIFKQERRNIQPNNISKLLSALQFLFQLKSYKILPPIFISSELDTLYDLKSLGRCLKFWSHRA